MFESSLSGVGGVIGVDVVGVGIDVAVAETCVDVDASTAGGARDALFVYGEFGGWRWRVGESREEDAAWEEYDVDVDVVGSLSFRGVSLNWC